MITIFHVNSIYENGINGHQQINDSSTDYMSPLKRQNTQNAFMFSHQQSLFLPNISTGGSSAHLFDYNQHNHQQRNEDSTRGDEEWRNIHVMLNCILSMVEKTKR